MIARPIFLALVYTTAFWLASCASGPPQTPLALERNRFIEAYAVKFVAKAIGEERDVVLMEGGDPRFAELRPILGTIFKPYPKPKSWGDDLAELVVNGRIQYENQRNATRRLEAWYFVPKWAVDKPYPFVATPGEPQYERALALLRGILNDPVNIKGEATHETERTMLAAKLDLAAVQVAMGDVDAAARTVGDIGPSLESSAPWHWLYRAATRYGYFTQKSEHPESVVAFKVSAKPMRVGPLTLAPVAHIEQPVLIQRWDVPETAKLLFNDNMPMVWPSLAESGRQGLDWVVVRQQSLVEYQHGDDLPLGVRTFLTDHVTGSREVLALAIENTGQNSVPLGKVSFSLIVDGKAGPTFGMLYDVPDQIKAVGIMDVAFMLKPGYTYQLYVDGPSLDTLRKVDAFTVRVFDMPQQIGPDGSVTKRGYVDIPFKVSRSERTVQIKSFKSQAPMVCVHDYSGQMVNVPTMRQPVYSAPEWVFSNGP